MLPLIAKFETLGFLRFKKMTASKDWPLGCNDRLKSGLQQLGCGIALPPVRIIGGNGRLEYLHGNGQGIKRNSIQLTRAYRARQALIPLTQFRLLTAPIVLGVDNDSFQSS